MKTKLTLTLALLAVLAGTASAAPQRSVRLKIGDAVDVVGTKIACFAITSNSKDGVACVLWANQDPIPGTFGAGLAEDGTATITKIGADGSGSPVFKRRLQSVDRQSKVYKLRVGDVFGWQIDDDIALGCKILRITDTKYAPLFRGVKVACYRATATAGKPNTYGVAISDRMAGVYRYDAQGNPGKDVIVRRQPQ